MAECSDVQLNSCQGSNNIQFNSKVTICEPIKNLLQLRQCLDSPPVWSKSIIQLFPRSNVVIKNEVNDCHYDSNSFIPRVRLDSRTTPRTLVCHDMKNGYLEDRFIGSVNIGNGYSFYQWSQIDIFVYFSHHFITIPPLSWINVAHSNGVKILGTLITEWQEGEYICKKIFRDFESAKNFADALIELCDIFKIEGWLLNIENKVENVDTLKMFVKYLTKRIHEKISGSVIIWYDSVTRDGVLAWQNELNEYNRCFFDLCDGIFTNYTWKIENLKNSVKFAMHRILDVFVGVDIFGRGCYGGGQFNSHIAAKAIREHNLSMALFAQGWTYETLPQDPPENRLERFFDRNNAFWKSLWPYLYTHPVNRAFETFFYKGIDKNFYNLHNQEFQLTHIPHPTVKNEEYSSIPNVTDSCDCLQLHYDNKNTSYFLQRKNLPKEETKIHHLFSCDIQLNGRVIIYIFTKHVNDHENGSLKLILLTQEDSGSFRRFICNYDEQNRMHDLSYTTVEVNPIFDDKIRNRISHPFQDSDHVEFRGYDINFGSSRLMEIGAEICQRDEICLSGIGMIDASVLENI